MGGSSPNSDQRKLGAPHFSGLSRSGAIRAADTEALLMLRRRRPYPRKDAYKTESAFPLSFVRKVYTWIYFGKTGSRSNRIHSRTSDSSLNFSVRHFAAPPAFISSDRGVGIWANLLLAAARQ